MVVFHNGRPMKKAYKKFAIKGFDGQNDVGSMQEVLQRRFTHYREDPEDSTFKILPDLILQRIPYRIEVRSLQQPYYRPIVLAMKQQAHLTPAVQKFIEYLPLREAQR